jgi:hypothetical protein
MVALSLMAVGSAHASVIYNVSVSVASGSSETVTGTITTDGGTRMLAASDFLSWDLTATGTMASTITSAYEVCNPTCSPNMFPHKLFVFSAAGTSAGGYVGTSQVGTSVPEPATLLGVGLAGLGFARRRRVH